MNNGYSTIMSGINADLKVSLTKCSEKLIAAPSKLFSKPWVYLADISSHLSSKTFNHM